MSPKAKTSHDKTVYILGAGFSAPAGGPKQGDLLKKILRLGASNGIEKLLRQELTEFLTEVLNVKKKSSMAQLQLEDIFTPIDRCLTDGVLLRGLDQQQLLKVRGKLEYLISKAIEQSFRSVDEKRSDYVRTFASYLVAKAMRRSEIAIKTGDAGMAKKYDPFALISLNWDILLDIELHNAMRKTDAGRINDYSPIGVVDYCCYVSSFDENDRRIYPGLWALGTKGYNVKLLKLHGSMNWLQCPTCQRMYVGFGEKLTLPNYIHPDPCRHCRRQDQRSHLRGTLVMPTFLKDLSNFQLRLVWQNAGVELMEARKLVFIGYSLPQADFEFRQLLSRMVYKKASIHVVLYRGKGTEAVRQYNEECTRYRQFFSGHKLTFEAGGVLKFVESLS